MNRNRVHVINWPDIDVAPGQLHIVCSGVGRCFCKGLDHVREQNGICSPLRIGGQVGACSNAPQNVSNEIDLPSTLSKYADLDAFPSLLNNFPDLLSRLENGNVTILAPSNNALTTYSDNSSLSADEQEALLTYHILNGVYAEADIRSAGAIFLPTLLTNIGYANVTGGQRVEAQSSDSTIYFLSGFKKLSNVITPVILTAVAPDPRILGVVGTESDWTYSMSQQDIFDLEAYHFVKGQVKYSTDLTNGLRIRTVLGKDVTVTRLNGSIYINAAKVIDPDYIITTGVLHLIDKYEFWQLTLYALRTDGYSAMNPNDTDARPEVANITGSPAKS
ncbi:hypothetical protein LTR41_011642 [Exophiala xenobiotica]|nr:hypothetical protein LTR41_011642 [Exophiala xenobiotica]KAK5550473.1 hypothetical protein LTR46_011525 [Exophiala xenobiotica]